MKSFYLVGNKNRYLYHKDSGFYGSFAFETQLFQNMTFVKMSKNYLLKALLT
jgi:hypothetical protein